MKLTATDWAALIPHTGTMCLLDQLVSWEARHIHMRSHSHRREDNPLREGGRLHAVHLIEYAAQATAVHGALQARAQQQLPPAGGRLVSLRDVWLDRDDVGSVDAVLDVHAEQLIGDRAGAHYLFQVLAAGQVLVSGRLAVMYAPPA